METVEIEATRRYADVNAVVGGYLRDLAFAQPSQRQMFGYKRAANVILALETPLTELLESGGRLPRIARIGPASARFVNTTPQGVTTLRYGSRAARSSARAVEEQELCSSATVREERVRSISRQAVIGMLGL